MFIAELEHPDFDQFDLSSLRTGIMAGSPCPIEVMKKVNHADAHARGGDRLRHDRDVSPVTQTPRRSLEEARQHGRPGPSPCRVKIIDPADRPDRPAWHAGRALLRGYSVMLGYWNNPRPPPRRSTPRAGCTRATWRRWTRRATSTSSGDEGHDHPGRRERLPARDRGVSVHPPDGERRAGDRRARREVRRGDHGLGA